MDELPYADHRYLCGLRHAVHAEGRRLCDPSGHVPIPSLGPVAYFQAKNIKGYVYEFQREQFKMDLRTVKGLGQAVRTDYEKRIGRIERRAIGTKRKRRRSGRRRRNSKLAGTFLNGTQARSPWREDASACSISSMVPSFSCDGARKVTGCTGVAEPGGLLIRTAPAYRPGAARLCRRTPVG